jgi:hypothetical protein
MPKQMSIAFVLWIVALMVGLGGCAAAAPSRFSTQLDTTGGIGPGDPVIHANATIGSVTGVAPLSGGDSEIGFEVDHSHAAEIRQDTIMVLTTQGGTPALEAFNTDIMSPAAPSGFPLDGASSSNEVQLFLAARGGGSVGQELAAFLKPLNTAPPPGSAAQSAAVAQMQTLFTQLSQQTIASAAASSPVTNAQLERMRREAEGVERQLRRNGNNAEADRLQQQVGVTLSGVGTPSNTLTIPRANPSTP